MTPDSPAEGAPDLMADLIDSFALPCAHPPGQHDANLSDGFGSEWACCENPGCDIQIVRPGKVQCSVECLFDLADYCDYCGWVEPDKHLATCNRNDSPRRNPRERGPMSAYERLREAADQVLLTEVTSGYQIRAREVLDALLDHHAEDLIEALVERGKLEQPFNHQGLAVRCNVHQRVHHRGEKGVCNEGDWEALYAPTSGAKS